MTPPTPPRPFPRGTDHYELSNGLLYAIVLTLEARDWQLEAGGRKATQTSLQSPVPSLQSRAPQSATRATPDPQLEPVEKRKHRKTEERTA